MEDMNLADDIVGCLIKTGNFSPRRIHSAGFSAGAMHTSEFSILRSSYVASVASYSGGLGSTPALPRPIVNRPSAMILHGGPRDTFGGSTEFAPRSVRYFKYTRAIGGAAIICNHGGGHTVPSMSNKPAVFRFFEDNTFDVRSAKYAEGQTLDGSVFPSYCSTTLP
ncbi:hypothetical protein DFS34DRAFT_612009 [Phlyctochytrium arcticum]|nr:hypothetical protein DFS34DRAFT_612009 [Phlyctochytrium arcticum]